MTKPLAQQLIDAANEVRRLRADLHTTGTSEKLLAAYLHREELFDRLYAQNNGTDQVAL